MGSDGINAHGNWISWLLLMLSCRDTLFFACFISVMERRRTGSWSFESNESRILPRSHIEVHNFFILERFLQWRWSFLFFIVTTLINNTFHWLQHEDNRVYQTQRLETTCLTRSGSIKKVSL
jgi:hypothetical protein